MHSSTCDLEPPRLGGAEVFVAIAALVTEGRTPAKPEAKPRGFSEGPHCAFSKASQGHVCNLDNPLCIKYDKIRTYVLSLWQKSLPLCIDVLLVPNCCCENNLVCNPSTILEPIGSAILLEQWNFNVLHRRSHDFSTNLNLNQLINAIRSQLYFSQISAWLAAPDEKIRLSFQDKSIVYCLTVPGETYGCTTLATNAQQHNFPAADLGNGVVLRVSLSNLPRSEEIPLIKCSKCDVPMPAMESHISVLDDRMQMSCTLKGKHRCDDFDEVESCCGGRTPRYKRNYLNLDTSKSSGSVIDCSTPTPSTSRSLFCNLSNLATTCTDGGTAVGTSKSKLHLNVSSLAQAENKCDNNKTNDMSKGAGKGCEKGGQLEASKVDLELSRKEFVEVLSVLRQSGPMKQSQNTKKHDLAKQSKGDILLDAILRSSKVQQGAEGVNMTAFCAVGGDLTGCKMVTDSGGDSGGSGIGNTPPASCLERNKRKCVIHKSGVTPLLSLYPDIGVDACKKHSMRVGDNTCDNKNDSITSDNRRLGGNDNIYIDINCDNVKRKKTDYIKMCDISNVFSLEYLEKRQKVKVKQKISFDEEHVSSDDKCNKTIPPCFTDTISNGTADSHEETCLKEFHPALGIPSALEQAKFRKSLDSAASMVFHSRTGLPLTSSPAPVRRGKSCFDFDSSINSVSAIRSALFSLASCSTDEDSESDCSIVSPCSPDAANGLKQREIPPNNYRHRGQSSGLLGSFVESVLNGRLEPVSTVHGFSAELGASGSFCPRHVVLPVTVFFYTLGDNDKVSTPYLGHINLGKKGYNVPKSGTIQVTLFNPLGTVVKMFVIMYDLSDMPPNSQTFIRQRTLFMPANCEDKNLEWSQKWLRYLIHLRFMSSKSGRIYLHSDIRMIICRKSDLDTATAHGIDMSYELRSFINSPTNPRFSPRK